MEHNNGLLEVICTYMFRRLCFCRLTSFQKKLQQLGSFPSIYTIAADYSQHTPVIRLYIFIFGSILQVHNCIPMFTEQCSLCGLVMSMSNVPFDREKMCAATSNSNWEICFWSTAVIGISSSQFVNEEGCICTFYLPR